MKMAKFTVKHILRQYYFIWHQVLHLSLMASVKGKDKFGWMRFSVSGQRGACWTAPLEILLDSMTALTVKMLVCAVQVSNCLSALRPLFTMSRAYGPLY